MSITALSAVTVYVTDQDEALEFYTNKLGFELRDDRSFPNGFRWLSVGIPGHTTVVMLELREHSNRAMNMPGAVGGNSTWVLAVDDCRAQVESWREAGVTITSEPTDQPYGVEAVIEDLYGNSYAAVELPAR